MIEINLLEHEFRSKKSGLSAGAGFPKEKVILASAAAAALIVIMHLFLFAAFLSKSRQAEALNKKWQELSPQRSLLEGLKRDYSPENQGLRRLGQPGASTGNWALRLNRMSQDLPYGVWFKALSFDGNNLILQGSAVSLEKEELSLINKFMDSLKGDKDFTDSFQGLELGAVQRRAVGGYDIVDFALTAPEKR